MVDKYHLTENGPKPCSAHIRSCPVGGAHFDTKDEAEHAYELEMGEREGFFKKLKRSSGLDPYTRHIAKANLRIAAEERDLKRRDERQNGGTIEHQLIAEGVLSPEELEQRFAREINTRQAGITYMKGNEGDARIIGIGYGGDYKAEEEYGMAAISDRLRRGKAEPKDALLFEHKGYKVLAIRGEERGGGDFTDDLSDRYNSVAHSLEEAVRRHENYQPHDQWRASLKYTHLTVAQLKPEFAKAFPGAKVPRSKKEIIDALVKKEVGDFTTPAIGEFQTGRALVLVTKDPAEARMFEKLKEANDTGNLRVGNSSNPFSRGTLFYDQRDLSRSAREDLIRSEEATKAAKAYVAPLKEKLKAKGNLYAVNPRVDGDLKDVRDATYILNFYPRDRRDDVWGFYNKQELELIAEGRYSEVPSIVERDAERAADRERDAQRKKR